MTVVGRILGWASWLAVAAWLYGVIWTHLDHSLDFSFPESFYSWWGDLLDVQSHDGSHYLFIWGTSLPMVLGLHAAAWVVLHYVGFASGPHRLVYLRWQRRVSAIVGWTSWLLVVTLAALAISDAIDKAKDGELTKYSGSEIAIIVASVFCAVGIVHLVALRIARRRRLAASTHRR
ncbi:hypothetical protein [Luteibacter sp.]|uniref:hypothetical protein n=1 Tax=Luteibacter sp. TaxID=1886636 RepID=UPI002F3EF1FB